ncbi:hypothetical protein F2Q69_00048090 [Brassica cretica]|uniref:Uncharacterized protein n=1 Tax=Brassica cretica TaxID=69181 RepID=A0A8S9PLQ9_BRACR|nr:hypothetical protein F2Q69_00048090 [Brassica cretica]
MLIRENNKRRLAPRVEEIEERGEVKTSSMFQCFGSFSLCLETDREKANRSAALSLSVDPRRDGELSTRRTVIFSLSVALLDGDEKPLFPMRLSLSVAPTRRRATAFSQWRAVDNKNADSLPLCGSPRRRQTAISPRI